MPSAPAVINEQSTDSEVFFAIRSQQVNALEVLYERYGGLVYTTAAQILNNVEEAEEVAQEIFLRLWQRSEIYHPDRGSLSGFLITMTRSRSIDILRSRRSADQRVQRVQIFADHVPDDNSPLEFVTVKERSHLVREALKQLSPDDRALLETAYFQGLSQAEISKRDGVPLGTVKTRSRQALKKLRTILSHLT